MERSHQIPAIDRRRLKAQLPRWVVALIVLCCLVEAYLTFVPLTEGAPSRAVAFAAGGFWSQLVWGAKGVYPGQGIVMFATYGLLHSGLMHLAMNMISLAAVGRELKRLIGSGWMAVSYVISQIAAAALFAVMEPNAGPMVGASGAIFGLAGTLVGYAGVVGYRRSRPLGPLWRGVITLLVLNVALTVLMPSIAWQAHVGGALAGLVIGGLLGLRPARR